jgi:two-component system, LytTR family, sensor histidine kinase AlgZ
VSGKQALLGAGSAFDVCHVGVVLRALLFVHLTLAVGTSFGAAGFSAWLTRVVVPSSVSLPALLLWLVLACLLKRRLARLAPAGQWVAAVLLGAASGLFGWGLPAA